MPSLDASSIAYSAFRSAWTPIAEAMDLIATPLRPSHYLGLLNPLWATHRLEARVEAVRDETEDARTLTLRPGRGWRSHRAGQFVRVGVSIDGKRHTRTYSISSSPDSDDGCIAITVKAVPNGSVSRFLARDLRPGAYLALGLPQGEFVLPEAVPVRPLFITAGSGITPVMSMLRTSVRAMPDTVHIHYAPRAEDVIFGEELGRIAAREPRYVLRSIYTRQYEGSPRRRFGAAQLDALCRDWRDRDVFACGPPPLLEAIEAHWKAARLGKRLHVERFQALFSDPPADAGGGVVRFAASGREIAADARTPLLRVAEGAGLNPPHGCRMGICHSCDATLVRGCVRDLRSGALRTDVGNKVQLCISAAAGDVEIDA